MSFYTSPTTDDYRLFTIDSTGYAVATRPNRVMRYDGWRSYQFMYIVRGRGEGDVEGTQVPQAQPHSVWIMPRDRGHGYRAVPGHTPWEYRWIEFGGDAAPDLLRMLGLAETPCVRDCAPARSLVERVVTLLETEGNDALHEASTLFLHALSIVARRARPGRPGRPAPQRVDQAAKRYIVDNVQKDFALEDLARAVRVSPAHLVRVFKRHNGTTPMAYLRSLRVEHAKSLLARGDLNVSEVGQRVGYPVLQHFSRMFKAETGVSPRAFVASAGR